MANFETQILESEKQVRAAQEKITAITSVIESARIKADQGIVLDVENATLEEWKDRPAQVETARGDLVASVRKMLGQ